MLILGISTSTPQIGVSVGAQDGVIASCHAVRGRHHSELLVPLVQSACANGAVALGDVGVVAVDIGPGLFTGLRVGVATAKSIATALHIPMIGISSLDLLAFEVEYTSRRIGAVIDARRGELFVAFYRPVPGGVQRDGEPMVVSPDDLAADIMASREDHLLVGNGALRYAEQLDALDHVQVADVGRAFPSSNALVQLAHAQAMRESWVTPDEIQCEYLRQPDAEINWQTRDGQEK